MCVLAQVPRFGWSGSTAPAAKLPYDRPDMTPDETGYPAPEQKARQRIDTMLGRAGWVVQDYRSVNLHAGAGFAVRELVTEKQSTTLSGVDGD